MKANEVKLLKFLQGPKQFLIPIFQRRYSWEKRHCDQLWKDIMRVGKDKNAHAHFLGSVVYMEHGLYSVSTIPQLLVIDGQQRLTTLSLLLSALGRAIEARGIEIGITQRRLENYYLFNADEDDQYRYKQLLTRRDNDTLIQLLENKELPADASPRLLENYGFFEEKLQSENLEVVYGGIQKLMIVDISLNRDYDNPQLIFESLNSTGLDLSQADLIRNYVLMGQERNIQNRLYEDYWVPMEDYFGDEYTKRFDRFIRDYLTLKTRRIPNIRSVYEHFKNEVDNKEPPEALEAAIAEISRYSKYYVRIALLKEEDSEIRACLEDLQDLKVEVAFPLLLGVYENYMQGKIERVEVIEIFRLIESYVFRRAICGIPTNTLNKTFAALTGQIGKDNYLQSLKVTFSRMTGNQRYPSDIELEKELLIKDVYNFDRCKYLLRKLENYGRKEPVRVEDYTIEHVMPQDPDLSEEWQEELGENWREVHEKYLHTIGNLTLTGYNSELSNRSFREKQEIPGGFRDSPLRLNESLRRATQWDKIAIVNRAKMLSEKVRKIWFHHGVSQEIQQEQKGDWTLANHHYLTGEMMDLFQRSRQCILSLDASISEQITKSYIGYSMNTIFAAIFPQAKRLRLLLNLPFSNIEDPQGLCRDMTNINGWGDVEVGLSSATELDYIMPLIQQAFQRQLAAPDNTVGIIIEAEI